MVPYVSYTQDEFPSSVQRIFLLATFHTKDVDLAKMASCGDVFRVWGEGDCPCINYREQKGRFNSCILLQELFILIMLSTMNTIELMQRLSLLRLSLMCIPTAAQNCH